MAQTPIVSLAGGHPLIDVDGTVIVQLVLFLVVFVIANRFLFQPYLALRERRRAGIEGARAEADRMTAQADAKLADYEKQLAMARERANEQGRKVRAEAAAEERKVTDEARATVVAETETAQGKMRRETEAARAQLMPQAEALAKAITQKLLGREIA
jgi:F-type H+-transporting ATPase subunit b